MNKFTLSQPAKQDRHLSIGRPNNLSLIAYQSGNGSRSIQILLLFPFPYQ